MASTPRGSRRGQSLRQDSSMEASPLSNRRRQPWQPSLRDEIAEAEAESADAPQDLELVEDIEVRSQDQDQNQNQDQNLSLL